jgi:trk system potassium uptake protein TrkA
LRQLTGLFPDLSIEVVAIIRDGKPFVPHGDDQLLAGDQMYFVADTRHVPRAMVAAGHEEVEARRVLILGGGNIGFYLAKELEEHYPGVSLRLIESNRKRAEYIAQQLTRAIVLHGDALDSIILEEAQVATTETIVALTNDDESNILASLLAKRQGAGRAITLINKEAYTALVSNLGIDAVVNPRSSTVSSILQHVRRGRIRAAHSIREGFAEILEGEALETSPLTNVPIRDLKLPAGVIVGAIVREGATPDDIKVLMPRPDVTIQAEDRVIILAEVEQVKLVEKLFSVRLEFF